VLRASFAGTANISATLPIGLSSPTTAIMVNEPNSTQSRSGVFSGNAGYMVTGVATLSQTGNQIILAFGADFKSSNGPMLGVYLAKNASGSPTGTNSVKLANLSNTAGMQQYDVPAGISLTDYNHVVIYCVPFNIRFGTATLN